MGSISGLGSCPGVGVGNPFLVFLSEKFHGQRILACYSPWDWSLTRLSVQNTWFLYMLLFNETSRYKHCRKGSQVSGSSLSERGG